MRIFCLLFISFIFTSNLWSQSRIVLLEGTEYYGFIIKVESDTLTLKTLDDFKIKFHDEEIYEIYDEEVMIEMESGLKYEVHIIKDLGKSYKVKNDNTIFEIPKEKILHIFYQNVDNSKSSGYFMLGASIGLPGGINANGGYRFTNKFGIRVSAGQYEDSELTGAQGNMDYIIFNNMIMEHGISFTFGRYGYFDEQYSKVIDYNGIYYRNWEYYGLSYFLNYYGIFAEWGLTTGTGDFDAPQMIGHVGYIYRFN